MAAHGRRREAERLGQFARSERPLAEQLDGAAPMRIGKGGKDSVDCGGQSSRFLVVNTPAASHSSELIFRTVTPNVQI